MGADVNSVTLVGRLTRDPEVRGNSANVLAMRLAFTSSRKAGDGWEDVPNYVDVVTFSAVDALSRLLERGDQVAVEGRLSWREWESKDGKRQAIEVVANRVQLLAKPKGKDASAPPRESAPAAPAPGYGDAPPLDDIPF